MSISATELARMLLDMAQLGHGKLVTLTSSSGKPRFEGDEALPCVTVTCGARYIHLQQDPKLLELSAGQVDLQAGDLVAAIETLLRDVKEHGTEAPVEGGC